MITIAFPIRNVRNQKHGHAPNRGVTDFGERYLFPPHPRYAREPLKGALEQYSRMSEVIPDISTEDCSNTSTIIGLFLWILMLTGCVPAVAPDLQSQREATRLVDQGTLFIRTGELDRAEASFKVAAELHLIPAAVDGLGCVAFLRGDYLAAEELFVRAYQMDNDYVTSLGNLALLYDTIGLSKEASEVYQRAIERDPENYRVRNNFAAFLVDERGMESARQEARSELLKAESIVPHPLIVSNLENID